MSGWVEDRPEGARIRVRVKPRSSREAIEEPQGEGELIVRVSAPPVDNQANQALINLLSKKLRVPKSALVIQTGETARVKTILVKGLSAEQAKAALGF
jgi:uncharacterized protein (TIGR00251 family)